jgi:hypothetical protein
LARFREHLPALEFRNGPAFLNSHNVTDAVHILRVVRVVFFAAPNNFLVEPVSDSALDTDDNGFVAGIAHHDTL